MSWEPSGNYLLVRLHTTGSVLELGEDSKYKASADVLGVGPDVRGPFVVGDVVLLNAAQGLIGHKELGEGIALVAAPLVLARQVGGVVES